MFGFTSLARPKRPSPTSKAPQLNAVVLRLFLTLTVAFFGFLGFPPASEAADRPPAPSRILIGLIPEMNVFQQMQRFQPLAQYIQKNTGIEVHLTILSRYGNIIQKFRSVGMDGAFFGSFTGAMAIEKLGVVPLVRPVNPDGESTYYGIIFARNDSGINTVADMKGKRFAFVERATTAGYIFPMAELRENGVFDLKAFFSETFFSGSHDATVLEVFNRQADVGAAKNTVYDRVLKNRPDIAQNLKVLFTSDRVPSNGLCLRPDIDPAIRDSLKRLLLEMDKDPEGRQVLEHYGALRFVETSVQDYEPVRVLARKAGISIKDYNYINE